MRILLDLPNETLYSTVSTDFCGIFNQVDKTDLKNIRGVCRRLRDVSTPLFRSTFFTTIAASIDSHGLSKLSEIAHHRGIAKHVITIKWMFDDMTSSDVYPNTLDQLRSGYTGAVLAMCFKRLLNLTCFIYALRNYDDVTVSFWQSLFSRCYSTEYADDPEEVVRQWWCITFDSMIFSGRTISSLRIDDDPHTLCLPPRWMPFDTFSIRHPNYRLLLHNLHIRINLNAQDELRRLPAHPLQDGAKVLGVAPASFSLSTTDIEDSTDKQLAATSFNQIMRGFTSMKHWQHFSVRAPTQLSWVHFKNPCCAVNEKARFMIEHQFGVAQQRVAQVDRETNQRLVSSHRLTRLL